MDTNLFISTATPGNPPVAPPNSGSISINSKLQGLEFKGYFESQISGLDRQSIATTAAQEPDLSLLTLSLGSKIDVITLATPMPNLTSLADFARSQGFDETAISTLFQDKDLSPSLNILSTIGTQLSPPRDLLSLAKIDHLEIIQPPIVRTGLGQSPEMLMKNSSSADNLTQVALAATISRVLVTQGPGVQSTPTDLSVTDSAREDHKYPEVLKIQLLIPNQDITKKLMEMAQTQKKMPWAEIKASQTTETLNLEVNPELLSALDDANQEVDLDTQTILGLRSLNDGGIKNSSQGASTNSGMQSSAEQRQLQFQQLADRLGQAMAERLISQIERGIWKMQMRMDPASLGKINISLDMHKNGLTAIFASENSITRELISQGTAKLKESLTDSGMTVASVEVDSDQSRQSGGNSTHERNFSKEGESSSKERSTDKLVTNAMGQTSIKDGWDILA